MFYCPVLPGGGVPRAPAGAPEPPPKPRPRAHPQPDTEPTPETQSRTCLLPPVCPAPAGASPWPHSQSPHRHPEPCGLLSSLSPTPRRLGRPPALPVGLRVSGCGSDVPHSPVGLRGVPGGAVCRRRGKRPVAEFSPVCPAGVPTQAPLPHPPPAQPSPPHTPCSQCPGLPQPTPALPALGPSRTPEAALPSLERARGPGLFLEGPAFPTAAPPGPTRRARPADGNRSAGARRLRARPVGLGAGCPGRGRGRGAPAEGQSAGRALRALPPKERRG